MSYEETKKSFGHASRLRVWLQRPSSEKLVSILAKTKLLLCRLEDALFEKRYGIRCNGFIEHFDIETAFIAARSHSRAYEAANCALVRELLREAGKTNIVFDHFIDLGAGKGRVCFYAATRRRFEKIIGVEFSDVLVRTADSNNQKFRDNFGEDNVSFVHENAADFVLPRGNNLIFLYNPFGPEILEQFLQRNAERFRKSESVIAYLNDKQRLFLATAGFITLFRNQDNQCSLHKYCPAMTRTATQH